MIEVPVGTYLVDRVSGALCVISNRIGAHYIVDAASPAESYEPLVMTSAMLADSFCIEERLPRRAAPSSPDVGGTEEKPFGDVPEEELRVDRSGAVESSFKQLCEAWGSIMERGLDKAEAKKELMPFKKQYKKDLAAFTKSLENKPWDQAASAMADLELMRVTVQTRQFIKNTTGKFPSDNKRVNKTDRPSFSEMQNFLLNRYITKDTMLGNMAQQNWLQQMKEVEQSFVFRGKRKLFDATTLPDITAAITDIGSSIATLEECQEVIRAAGDIVWSDPSTTVKDKVVEALVTIIDGIMATTEIHPSFGADAAITESDGEAKIAAFLAVSTSDDTADYGFRYAYQPTIDLVQSAYNEYATKHYKPTSKGQAALTPEQEAVRVMGDAVLARVFSLHLDPSSQHDEFKAVVSATPDPIPAYLSGISDKLEELIGKLQATYDYASTAAHTEYEKLGEAAKSPARVSAKLLTGKAAADMAVATWMTTDFMNSFYKIIEKKTGISSADMDYAVIDYMPAGTYLLAEQLGAFSPERLPTSYVSKRALAWGALKGAQGAYAYIVTGPGGSILMYTSSDNEQKQVGTFTSEDAALDALGTKVAKVHQMVLKGDKVESGDYPVREVSDIVSKMLKQSSMADKLREALNPRTDPEVKELFDSMTKMAGIGHPYYLRILNTRWADASTPAEMIRAVYDVSELIRTSRLRFSVNDRHSGIESAYFDKSQSKEGKPKQTPDLIPLTVTHFRDSLSKIALPAGDVSFDETLSIFFQGLYATVLDYAVREEYTRAQQAIAEAPAALKELEAKQAIVAVNRVQREFFRIPVIKLDDPATRFMAQLYESPFEELRVSTQRIINQMSANPGSMQMKSSNLIGAEHMSDHNLKTLVQGQPVTLNGYNNVHVVVSKDDTDPFKYYLIPESSINSHDRVELIEASIMDISPLKIYKVEVGDVLEVKGSLAKVTDTSSADIGIAQLLFQGATESVNYPLKGLPLPSKDREPYKLVQCSKDGGYTTPEDLINCPFEGAEGHLVNAVAHYKPRIKTACMEPLDPELEKKFRHDYEVAQHAELDEILQKTSFAEVDPAPVKYREVVEDEDGVIEIGARVKKFGSTTVGTVLGQKQACWVVAWEGGKEEMVWPQECHLVQENSD